RRSHSVGVPMIRQGIGAARLHLRNASVLVAAVVACLLVVPASPTAAQDWWFGSPSTYPRRAMRPTRHPGVNHSRVTDEVEQSHKGKAPAYPDMNPMCPLFATS